MTTKRKSGPADLAEALEAARRDIFDALPSAIAAARELCEDKKAPAQARSAASNSILRAAGLFDRPGDRVVEKEAHEMTRDEMLAYVRKLDRDLKPANGGDQD